MLAFHNKKYGDIDTRNPDVRALEFLKLTFGKLALFQHSYIHFFLYSILEITYQNYKSNAAPDHKNCSVVYCLVTVFV